MRKKWHICVACSVAGCNPSCGAPPPVSAIYFSFQIQHPNTGESTDGGGGGGAEREADNHACASSSPSLAGPLLTLKQCFLDPPPPSPSKYQRQGGPNNNSDAGALSKPCYFQPAPAPSSALVGLVGLVGCILTALRHNFSGTATHPPASLLYFLAQSPFPQQRDQKCRQNGPFPGPAPRHQ